METKQNKFAFFSNFSEAIQALPKEKQAGAYQAICEYGIYGILPEDPMYLGLCLMAKASLYKEDGRSNNGGNHNPKGINQHSENGQSGQSRSNQVNLGQSGQSRSIPLETETETRNKKLEVEKENTAKEKVKQNDFLVVDENFFIDEDRNPEFKQAIAHAGKSQVDSLWSWLTEHRYGQQISKKWIIQSLMNKPSVVAEQKKEQPITFTDIRMALASGVS